METVETKELRELAYVLSEEEIHEKQGNFPRDEEANPIKQQHLLFGKVDIFVLGKPTNWRGGIDSHPELVNLISRHVPKVYVPNTRDFCGTICPECDDIEPKNHMGIEIISGCRTEGMIVPHGSAIFMRTADCPVIVLFDRKNDILIVAHAGLSSVIDRNEILRGEPSRTRQSVVDDIVQHFKGKGENTSIKVLCGIGPESFIYSPKDKEWGRENEMILRYIIDQYGQRTVPFGFDYGGISIGEIIQQQFLQYDGFLNENIYIDETDTFKDSNFWSHRRSVLSREEHGRNAILVVHR